MNKHEAKRYVRAMIIRSLEHDLDELGADWIYEGSRANTDPVRVETAAREILAQMRRRWRV